MNPLARIKVQIDGSEKTALVQVIDQKFWCRIDNVTHCFDLSDLSSSSTTRNQKTKSKNSKRRSSKDMIYLLSKIVCISSMEQHLCTRRRHSL